MASEIYFENRPLNVPATGQSFIASTTDSSKVLVADLHFASGSATIGVPLKLRWLQGPNVCEIPYTSLGPTDELVLPGIVVGIGTSLYAVGNYFVCRVQGFVSPNKLADNTTNIAANTVLQEKTTSTLNSYLVMRTPASRGAALDEIGTKLSIDSFPSTSSLKMRATGSTGAWIYLFKDRLVDSSTIIRNWKMVIPPGMDVYADLKGLQNWNYQWSLMPIDGNSRV